jgi:hypothetical protein
MGACVVGAVHTALVCAGVCWCVLVCAGVCWCVLVCAVVYAPSPCRTLLSGITTMETNVCTYLGIEQESMSLIHWPTDPAPLLNIGVKDPLSADVDGVLQAAKARVKTLVQVGRALVRVLTVGAGVVWMCLFVCSTPLRRFVPPPPAFLVPDDCVSAGTVHFFL